MDRPKKVLICDDDLDFATTVAYILETEKCVPVVAESGEKAVEQVRRTEFDLVLMDIMMPGIGGVEAIRKIKRIDPKIRVIVMTGFSVTETINEALREGAVEVLYKPFDVDNFVKLVQ